MGLAVSGGDLGRVMSASAGGFGKKTDPLCASPRIPLILCGESHSYPPGSCWGSSVLLLQPLGPCEEYLISALFRKISDVSTKVGTCETS